MTPINHFVRIPLKSISAENRQYIFSGGTSRVSPSPTANNTSPFAQGATPAHGAAQFGHLQMLRLLDAEGGGVIGAFLGWLPAIRSPNLFLFFWVVGGVPFTH